MAEFHRAQAIERRLEARPCSIRTRGEYERALDAYRAVYHGDPASPDAAPSIAAVADLLTSEGRCFQDAKLLRDAIGQWEFLRKQYPGSPLRRRALLEQAEIGRHDLHERKAARNSAAPQGLKPAKGSSSYGRAEARPLQTHTLRTSSLPAAAAPINGPSAGQNASDIAATIQSVRQWAEGNSTRVAVDLSAAVPSRVYSSRDGRRITVLFFGAQPSGALVAHAIPVQRAGNIRSMQISALTGDQTALVLDLNHPADVSSFPLSGPARWILDLRPMDSPAQSAARATTRKGAPARAFPSNFAVHLPAQTAAALAPEKSIAAEQPANAPNSMSRVLGLRVRRIVIDAGHGGHDSGTLGPGGIEEKDVALDVALRLGRLLHRRLGADVIYTRHTDVFVPLEERTAIANRAHADLFLSIHANSSSDAEVRGVETYYLNFTASPDALAVAARENASSNRSVYELSGLVRKIAMSDKIDESRVFAEDVQQSLYNGLAAANEGLKDRGVKQAPFVVLIGANMPSILAEISFLTNPRDAEELRRPAYRQRIAEDLYRGVAQYVESRSGVRMANTAQPAGATAPAE